MSWLKWLLPALLLGAYSCAPLIPAENPGDVLEGVPAGCRVRTVADSWEGLLSRSKPTCVLGSRLLLWCTPAGGPAWNFEVAQPFLLDENGKRQWIILTEPEDWRDSGLEGEFVAGTATYPQRDFHDGPLSTAEKVGASSRGDVYKVSCPCVPGGVHGNARTLSLLLQYRSEKGWELLWSGFEATQWSMGFSGVNESYRFRVEESSSEVQVDHEYSVYPSFDLDRESWRILEVHRSGRLIGPAPMSIDWSAPWLYAVKPGDTWEKLAENLLFYEDPPTEDIAGRAATLRADAGVRTGHRLQAGDRIVLRSTLWP